MLNNINIKKILSKPGDNLIYHIGWKKVPATFSFVIRSDGGENRLLICTKFRTRSNKQSTTLKL